MNPNDPTRTPADRGILRLAVTWALALVAIFISGGVLAGAADARAEVAAVVGAEYYRGPADQETRGLVGALSFGLTGGGFLSAAGVRYDDNLIGPGIGITGGFGTPLGGESVLLRVDATRYLGDGAYRAWRLRAGPFVQWGGGVSLGVSFLHYDDNALVEANGVIGEIGVPVAPRWRAALGGSVATLGDGSKSTSGSAGVTWSMAPHLELSAEAGIARNGALGTSQPQSAQSSRGPLEGLPLLGGGSGSAASRPNAAAEDVSGTFLLGLRVPFP